MSTNAAAPARRGRVLLRWCGRLVALLFAVVVAAALVVVVVLPRATQGSAMTVLTGSMTPQIPVGSIVMVRPVDPATLQVGDVATYQKAPGEKVYVTHRIVEIDSSESPTQFTFKGDANRGPDLRPVTADQIRGEVWFHVPYLGAIRDGLHGKGGTTLVAMLLLAAYALAQVGAGLRERRKGAPPAPLEVAVNQALVVATLETDRLASRLALSPTAAAALWSGVVIHENDHSCTLLLQASTSGRDERLALLDALDPVRLVVMEGPATLTGRAVAPHLDQEDRERAAS